MKKILVACGSLLLCCRSPQPDSVEVFLTATKNRDLATLARVSVVGLPGEVLAWQVLQTTTSQVETFPVENIQRRLNAARAARDAQLKVTGAVEDVERIQFRVERLRGELEREREAARKSVATWSPIDEFDGEVDVRDVTVKVRSRDGERTYSLTLKRYRLVHSENGARPPSRWIVTAVQAGDP